MSNAQKDFVLKGKWTLHDDFCSKMNYWWNCFINNANVFANLASKLRLVRYECKKWCRQDFYSVKKDIIFGFYSKF